MYHVWEGVVCHLSMQGRVIWHHVNQQLQSWTGEVSHLQPQSLMAAVSAQFISSSSSRHLFSTGMQWSHCVYNVTARMSTCLWFVSFFRSVSYSGLKSWVLAVLWIEAECTAAGTTWVNTCKLHWFSSSTWPCYWLLNDCLVSPLYVTMRLASYDTVAHFTTLL